MQKTILVTGANGQLGKSLQQIAPDNAGQFRFLFTDVDTLDITDLAAVRSGLDAGTPTDLVAEDLRSAIRELGSIFGEIAPDEVLGRIFSKFCIGK